VPSASEAGLPDVQVISFNGVLAPVGTPPEIVARLNAEIVKVMQAPAMKELMEKQAGEVSTSTPQEFADVLKTDFDMWLSIIKANGIRIE
jgi:tripartite-type tricarboxylate transporter receptor subunit TctC